MDSRYRYNRPRSPTLYNPARISLPINLAYPEQHQVQHHHHLHAIPVTNIRREVIPIAVSQPRSSNDRINTAGPVTTTTYKIKTEPSRGSSIREGSRTRRATIGSQDIPTVITTIAPPSRQHRPVVHGSSNGRSSPVGNPYRSSAEDQYYSVPASSNKHRHHRTHRYSATMDDADMNRLARESGRVQIERGRDQTAYDSRTSSRPTSMFTTTSIIRQPETTAVGYGDDGYGYTNPKDLVEYDLENDGWRHQHSRRDSYDGNRTSRSSSVNGYNQIARPYDNRDVRDTRERGPPPSTRGFAQVNARTWPLEQPVQQNARMSIPAPPVMDPIQRPHSARPVASLQRPERVEPPFDGPLLGDPQSQRRSSSRRPVSVYQDRERRPAQRDDGREYYDPRDDDLRRDRKHQKSRDDLVDQRTFARQERSDRDDRGSSDYSRSDRQDRTDRVERREERSERRDERRSDLKEYSSGRDALAAGLSTAAAALGLGAIAKKASRDEKREEREKEERLEREEQRRRDDRDREDRDREEARRRRDREEREATDAEERAKERRREEKVREERAREERAREDERKREELPMLTMKPKEPDAATFLGLNGRDPTERQSVPVAQPVSRGPVTRDEREDEPERRRRPEPVVTTNLSAPVESRGDSSPSDGKRSPRRRRPSAAATFNPRDALDLRALKEELAAKQNSPPIPPQEPLDPVPANPIPSSSPTDTKTELRDDRGRLGPLAPAANAAPERQPERQLRVVSPPREKEADKPVKGILRQPRERFPEDPSPIREGVAPLKDAKKDGVPPDARWTKINRKLVNPEALEAGKERYEAREDFVIVLRVLSKEEVQAYAIATQQIREGREVAGNREEREASDRRRRARRERHERHKRDRESGIRGESTHRSRRRGRHQDDGSDSQSDETTDEEQRPKMLEHTPRHAHSMSGALRDPYAKEPSIAANTSSRRRND